MKGDFSRLSFDKNKQFSRVLMQQGRVQLDSDWNEQNSILLHYMRSFVTDALLDEVKELSHGGVGDGFKLIGYTQDGATLYGLGMGRYYVDGILCENFGQTEFETEDPISNMVTSHKGIKLNLDLVYGDDLIYLDVWERHITAVEMSSIAESALNGLDTTTRTQVVWQVKVAKDSKLNTRSLEDFERYHDKTNGKLHVVLNSGEEANEPCYIPPQSLYRGLENQLYRIEIHDFGQIGESTPTFKWSRENGTIVYAIDSFEGQTVQLKSISTDPRLSIKEGDWVEIISGKELPNSNLGMHYPYYDHNESQMMKVNEVNINSGVLVLSDTVQGTLPMILRRWDQFNTNDQGVVEIGEEPISIEDGLTIQFSTENETVYRPGDYWLITARVGENIEWPEEGAKSMGIQHHYAPIALFIDNALEEDLRNQIKPLWYNYDSDYSPSNHLHEYAGLDHTHSEYGLSDHTHPEYGLSDHTHSEYGLSDHTHSDYALSDHTHDGESDNVIEAEEANARATASAKKAPSKKAPAKRGSPRKKSSSSSKDS